MTEYRKLTLWEHLGYGSASFGDSISYTFIGSYLLVYLTTVIGMKPVLAGIITGAGSVWNALINPVIGYFADRVQSRFGRRRFLLLLSAFPLAASVSLLFIKIVFSLAGTFFYYAFWTVLFWTSYTSFLVPYLALGAEYTEDYDDRTKLRLISSQFNTIGSMLALAFPPTIRKALMHSGASETAGWAGTACLIAAMGFISLLITFTTSRKFDRSRGCCDSLLAFPKGRESFSFRNLFREYISIAGLKPMRLLLSASLFFLIAYEIYMANLIYFFTYNIGFSFGWVTLYLSLRGVFGTLLLPVSAYFTHRFDKKYTLILAYIAGGIGMVVLYISGFTEAWERVFYMFLISLSTCVYWQLIPSMYYDISDYDCLKTGKNRQAAIVSFQGLLESAALGIGSFLLGFILQIAGFRGSFAVQTETANLWIGILATVGPLCFTAVGIGMLWIYPIDRKTHRKILEEIWRKNRGRRENAED
ncbi:MAG: MFS transporter [Eubacteriales bacterium]|nr:MFS transporter [Eubacteriales bacterium]